MFPHNSEYKNSIYTFRKPDRFALSNSANRHNETGVSYCILQVTSRGSWLEKYEGFRRNMVAP
jgi:hypothetical protein